MKTSVLNIVVFCLGWLTGSVYRRWVKSRAAAKTAALRDRLRAMLPDLPIASWGTVWLSIAVICLGFVYWNDHRRWDHYLDCQNELAVATVARAPATVARDAAQSDANASQFLLDQVLYDISISIPIDGNPPTHAERQTALEAYSRLPAASERARDSYDDLVRAQRTLDDVRDRYTLPVCGDPPD